MTVTVALFRQVFREFRDIQIYDDGLVNFWVNLATNATNGPALLNPDRWGNMLDLGVMLFTAHHLALGQMDQQTAGVGGVPGQLKGPVTSKTVDKISASYEATRVTFEDAPFWNQTSYGIRFLNYARMVGAGGVHVQ
jgi:hypothetical protein